MEFTMAILFFVFPLTRAELRHSSEKERKKRERERERERERGGTTKSCFCQAAAASYSPLIKFVAVLGRVARCLDTN
jgi:hypothetical protein